MTDPYKILGLSPESDESAVRRRYLELVRQHPPDRSPERFVEIRAAYEALRDPVKRLETRLFEVYTDDSLENIIAEVQDRLLAERIPVETLLSLSGELKWTAGRIMRKC